MKKLLALTLALTLACSLCVPALAAEETGAVEQMEELGLLDGSYETDVDYEDYGYDFVAEYEQVHPGELENLDTDALIAAWGFTDVNMTAQEAFLDYYSYYDGSVDEVVKQAYVEKRGNVEYQSQEAETYKTDYPEQWETFDADAYFAQYIGEEWGWESKEAYMAHNCILTQEEFVAVMFWDYCTYHSWEWDADGDPDLDADPTDPDAQPTLTLVVNGVASDVAITAGEGVTYADAAALRGILGAKAVAPTYEGPVPVREAAENAGWEVQWYDGGWKGLDQQVCLWNKDAFVAEVKTQTEPYQTFYDAAMENSRNTLFAETPKRAASSATVTFQRFNSLDGNKTYTLKLRAESVWHKGVVDYTVTFDIAQLLGMFTADELETMAKDAQLSLADLKALFSAGKAEFIIDYNSGGIACNIPLLGLIDEDLEGWQTTYSTMLDYSQENMDYAEIIYENMLITASWMGGLAGREEADDSLEDLGVYFGPDSVQTTGGSVTWTLETDKVNAALSKLIGDGDGAFSFFKKCDLNMTLDAQGKTDLTLALRPDIDGIVEAAAAEGDETNALANGFMRWLLGCLDMEFNATANGDADKAAETMKLHIKNFGVFDANVQSTTKPTSQTPRQLAEVERQWVQPTPGTTVTVAN